MSKARRKETKEYSSAPYSYNEKLIRKYYQLKGLTTQEIEDNLVHIWNP